MNPHARTATSTPASPAQTSLRHPGWAAKLLWATFAMLLGFLAWREFEPLVLFRPVDGVVVWTEIVWNHTGPSPGRNVGRHTVQVTYRYQVDGEEYLSAQVRRTDMRTGLGRAKSRARRYVIGTRIQAWYNPFHPADAVLSRAPNFVLLGILAMFWFMFRLFSVLATARSPASASARRSLA